MAKQLNVNVAVTADTTQAKIQLQNLQSSLQQLTNSSANSLKININTSALNAAKTQITELTAQLNAATNKAGVLDFSKLNASLASSKTSLADYGATLASLGPQGQQALAQLTQSVAQAEIPTKRLTKMFGEFGTVLKNTIKWQAASSIIHGMMGNIQHAFSYAEELNKSLNKIQIVTQASNEQMAKFAENANKAAQRLNTTTRSYTDASLIYYQQGLNDKEVAARTETTIKMANASGQSAAAVSDQMTAIWNNFANGSVNLEHYADVITALGAATASSSSEIATGLQKFAAAADTVGFSYEHAAAAMATITAATRQSADTVGTGLRTLLARLQSVNLGETLEDGVTLTKYTKALESIGVSVLDYSGNLRNADDIIQDMGEKWQTLSRAQQTAVAQTVGGVRQYTTIMSLMENFDEYQKNIRIGNNSDGTVQAQADIYAKSWEASQKRVKAASEALYSDLIDDQFFITLNDGLAGALSLLDRFIDSLGGLKGLLGTLGVIATKVFNQQIVAGITNASIKMTEYFTPQSELIKKKQTQLEELVSLQLGAGASSVSNKSYAEMIDKISQNSQMYSSIKNSLNPVQLATMNQYQTNSMNAYNQAIAAAQQVSITRDKTGDIRTTLYTEAKNAVDKAIRANDLLQSFNGKTTKQLNDDELRRLQRAKDNGYLSTSNGRIFSNFSNTGITGKNFNSQFTKDFNQLQEDIWSSSMQNVKESLKNIQQQGGNYFAMKNAADSQGILKGLSAAQQNSIISQLAKGTSVNDLNQDLLQQVANKRYESQGIDNRIEDLAAKYNVTADAVRQYVTAIEEEISAKMQEGMTREQAIAEIEKERAALEKLKASTVKAQNITAIASSVFAMTTTVSTLTSVTNQWIEVAKTGEGAGKAFMSSLTGIAISAMMVIPAITKLAQTYQSFSILGLGSMGSFALIAGAIAALAIIIPVLAEAIETPSEKLERLKTEAEEAQNAAEEAAQAYDDFISNQSVRNAVLEEIQQLTQGTQEYINKVKEANELTQQMVSGQGLQYGKDYWYDSEGILQMSAEAEEKIASNLERRAESEKQIAAFKQLDFENVEKQSEIENRNGEAREYRIQAGSDFASGGLQNLPSVAFAGGKKSLDLSTIGTGGAYAYAQYLGIEGKSSFEVLTNLLTTLDDAVQNGKNLSLEYGTAANEIYQRFLSSGDSIEDFTRGIISNAEGALTPRGYNLESFAGQIGVANGYSLNDNGQIPTNPLFIENEAANARAINSLLPSFESILISTLGEQRLETGYNKNKYQESWAMEDLTQQFQGIYQELQKEQARIKLLSDEDLEAEYRQQHNLKSNESIGVQFYDTNGNLNKEALQEAVAATNNWQLIGEHLNAAMSLYDNSGVYDWDNLVSWLNGETLESIYQDESLNQKYKVLAQETIQAANNGLRTALTSNLSDANGELSDSIKGFIEDFISPDNLAPYTVEQRSKIANLANTLPGENSITALLKNLTSENIDQMFNMLSGGGLNALFNSLAEAGRTGNTALKAISDGLIKDLGGETGILSNIFGEEDFQKGLKKVQKEFRKTGKISTKNVDDIADSCEDLSEALDLNILSAGAVADAIDLYSIGAISSIEDISEELWAALEAANAFEDSLRNAFNYIDNWSPDRSITDLDDFFSKVSKDYFEELKQGTTGSTRLYQDAEALWGKQYSQNLRRFFFDQETGQGTMDNPQARAANYQKTFGEFDKVWENVQKQGNLLPYWNFLLGSTGNTAANINQQLYGSSKGQVYNAGSNISSTIVNKTGMESGKEYTVSEALGFLGLSQGKNNEDIEFTDYGLTTDEMRQGIKSVLGLNDDQADAYLQEMSGHSQFMATALQSNDLQAGYDTLIGKYKDKGIHYNEYNGQMYGTNNNGHEYADYSAMADMQNYALANRDFLDYYSKLGKDLETKHDNGTLTAEEEKQYDTWVRNRDAINNLNDSVKKYDESVQKLNDSYDTHIKETDKASEAMEKAWGDLSTEQQERIKASASGTIVGQGETGTKEEGKDIYDIEGMLEHTKNLLGAKADDMSPEELWEAAAQQAENYGGVLGTKLTNAYGEVKDVTREADESQEDYNKRLQEAKNALKSSENKQLGKDLFQGIVDAIKELDPATLNEQIKPVIETINELAQAFASLDGSAESIQALTTAFNELAKLPTIFGDGSIVENLQNLVITLNKISGTEFKLDISTSLSPDEISHLAKDFDDMYAKKNIEISIKIIDDASVQQFKGDKQGIKSTLEALNKAAQINLKINGLETLGRQVKAAIDAINATNPTVHVKLDKDQPEGPQGGSKGPSEKPNSSRSTTNSDTKAPSAHSGASKSTVQTEVKSTAKITKVDASDVEPVEIKAEPQFQKNGSRDQSMKIQVLPVVEEEALEEIAKPVDKDVTLNKHSEEIDNYIAEVPSKTVDLLVGKNEPQAAIDALPTSHSLAINVSVSVSGGNAFGSSISFSGGGEVLGSSAFGRAIDSLATNYATSHPKMQAFIDGTRKHYQKGTPDCSYGDDNPNNDVKGAATGTNIYRSYVNGSSNRYSKPGLSLTAEEGPEIIWNKMGGYAYIVGGEGHPEFAYLQPGDRVFNANDTRQILNYHRPKSNTTSAVKDPREMSDTLFGSHAGGSAYGSYGPQSTYRSSRGKSSGRSSSGEDKYERKKFYEPERYHLLTRQIEDLTFWYNELKKVRERAYGTNILKAIDAEIAKVDELKKHNQLLLEEAENYLEKDRALLDELGIQYELDNEGNLANFEELQDQYKKLLELEEDANGEKIEDEQLDELQERWNAIEKYEETLDKIRDIKEEISDLKYEAEDLAFEKIELEFNMKIDFTDRQLSLIDHFLEKLKGNTADAAEMLAVASQKMDLLAQNAQTATEKINSVFIDPETQEHLMVTDDITGEQRDMTYQDFLDMTPEERSALNISKDAGSIIESSMDKIQQCLEDLEELKTVGLETVSQAIEELTANVEKQIQVFDHYSNMLSALRNITDLQGIKITKELRQTLKQIDESMIQVSKDRITAEKEKYDGLSKMAEDLRKKVQQYAGVDEDLRKGYQEQLDNIEGQMRESMETVLSMYQNALQTAKDMFEATMDEIKEDYNASLSDIYNTTQLMQEAFDRKTAISEQYVDEYESYYKLNKLQRQINKDIDNQMANGNRANKNLKKLLNEIQKLQEDGIQLTAYDLELLEKKYEYEKALADLEDARNAKQTIRLQRDRNGNWGYVYTAADETDLEEYQQAIEDKLYEYTQTATQQAKDLEKELLSIWVETGEKIAQLRMEGAPSSAINDLIDDTQKRADFLTESLKKAGEDINYVLPNWIDLTQNEQFDLSLDDFKETVLSYVTGIEDVEAVSQKMMKAIINIAKETKMAVDTYNASIEEINAFVSGGTGDFNASAQTWAAQITKASQENVEKTKEAVDDMVDTFRDVLKEASAFENKFFNEIKPFIQQQEQILIQLTDAMSQLNGLPSNLQNLQDAAALANGQAKATSYIDENGHTQTQITHLDEGGYTGEWGPGGKLAVLHEKENVFNKKDTINLLKAANILRTLDIQTGNFERGLGEFFNPSVKDNKQTFEQEVYITAEFPNATNHSEIEEAFNNLANRATQYANRKVG